MKWKTVLKILLSASREESRPLFFRTILIGFLDFGECSAAAIWLPTGTVYRCFRRPAGSFEGFSAENDEHGEGFKRFSEAALVSRALVHEENLHWCGNLKETTPGGGDDKILCMYLARFGGETHTSFAIAPLKSNGKVESILILSDARKNHFNPKRISNLEQMVDLLQIALGYWQSGISLKERVKELSCLYSISRVAEKRDLEMEEIFRETIRILPSAWFYPEDIRVRIILDGRVYANGPFPEERPRLGSAFVIDKKKRGLIEVAYAMDHPHLDSGPFLHEEVKLLETISRELTLIVEKKFLENEKLLMMEGLKHADRLNIIGRLTASVAHEINEPLTSILGYAQLAAKSHNLPDQTLADLERIIATSLRARDIVRKLLIFSRKMPLNKRSRIDINQVLEESLHFFKTACEKEGIRVVCRLSKDLPPIFADQGQLRQLFSNLLLNAIQAMPSGGDLILETGNSGEDLLIAVEDTGCGILPEETDKIFIPFYTTKQEDKGTGLGLTVAQEIVTAHGGALRLAKSSKTGARFEVLLPASLAKTTERIEA